MNQDVNGRAPIDLKGLVEAYERKLILDALLVSGGHQRRAAALLGVLPTTLHEKMRRLGIPTRLSGATNGRLPSPGLTAVSPESRTET
jgi:DNA-binding NtrC family response regulator